MCRDEESVQELETKTDQVCMCVCVCVCVRERGNVTQETGYSAYKPWMLKTKQACHSEIRVNESDGGYQTLNSLRFGVSRRIKSEQSWTGSTLRLPLLQQGESSHWLLLETYPAYLFNLMQMQLYAPLQSNQWPAHPPKTPFIETLLLRFGFILQASCECVRMFAYQNAFVFMPECVCMCASVVCEREAEWAWRWKQLFGFGALLRRENIYIKKTKTFKYISKIRHKWQMAILVALRCCSPLAYNETSFYSVFFFFFVKSLGLVCPKSSRIRLSF